MQLKLLVTPQGAAESDIAQLQDWEFEYHVRGATAPMKVHVTQGYLPNQFAVTLSDVSARTTIASLLLTHLPTQRKWAYRTLFAPLEPAYALQQEP